MSLRTGFEKFFSKFDNSLQCRNPWQVSQLLNLSGITTSLCVDFYVTSLILFLVMTWIIRFWNSLWIIGEAAGSMQPSSGRASFLPKSAVQNDNTAFVQNDEDNKNIKNLEPQCPSIPSAMSLFPYPLKLRAQAFPIRFVLFFPRFNNMFATFKHYH